MTEEKKGKPQENSTGIQSGDVGFFSMEEVSDRVEKPSLLLHSCCGPCSTVAIERLASEYQITVFFYNPCITDEGEYKCRREAQIDFVNQYNGSFPPKDYIHFMEGPYDARRFFQVAKGLEEEVEGGRRCRECFQLRLEKTAETAKLSGWNYFATTLSVSPHKDWEILNKIGQNLAVKYSLSFLDWDFKKQNGYQRSVELSKKHGLYRQSYCGCEYSKKKLEKE